MLNVHYFTRNWFDDPVANVLQVPFSSASSTPGTTKRLPYMITSIPAAITTEKALGDDIRGQDGSMRCI